MKVAFAEQTVDMDIGQFTVRVWRATSDVSHWTGNPQRPSVADLCRLLGDSGGALQEFLQGCPNVVASMQDVRAVAHDYLGEKDIIDGLDDHQLEPNVAGFLEHVTKMPGVTAVQVIRKSSGDGIVIYTEWP